MKIYFLNNTEPETAFIVCGRRGDVIVQMGDNYYSPFCMTLQELYDLHQMEFEDEGCYPRPMTVVVKEASSECIIQTLKMLCKDKYFDAFKPKSLQDIETGWTRKKASWIKVYED